MEHELVQPFELVPDAWEALCVRCDGTLVGTEADLAAKLCGICVTGPTTGPIWQAPSQQRQPDVWSRLVEEADEIVVDAIIAGVRFEGQMIGERTAAAVRLIETRPDMCRREIAEAVGLCHRTITRIVARQYRKGQRKAPREDVIENLMAGRNRNRINPTVHETGEAVKRLIRQGMGDRDLAIRVGCTVSVVAGHRHRMKQRGEDVPDGKDSVRRYGGIISPTRDMTPEQKKKHCQPKVVRFGNDRPPPMKSSPVRPG